jgi:hypothetical protein
MNSLLLDTWQKNVLHDRHSKPYWSEFAVFRTRFQPVVGVGKRSS